LLIPGGALAGNMYFKQKESQKEQIESEEEGEMIQS
jgi:hypothetical protein